MYYNITYDIPDLFFKSAYLFIMNPANVCLTVQSQQLSRFEICSQLTIKTLERRHCLHC